MKGNLTEKTLADLVITGLAVILPRALPDPCRGTNSQCRKTRRFNQF